jgi:hypothetical protein
MQLRTLQTQTVTQNSVIDKLAEIGGLIKFKCLNALHKIKKFAGDTYEKIRFMVKTAVKSLDDDEPLIEKCQQVIINNLGASPYEAFTMLSTKQRYVAVNNIVSSLAGAMEVPVYSVEITDMGSYLGTYAHLAKRVRINSAPVLENPMTALEAKEIIDTIVHEMRHAYQYNAASKPSYYGLSSSTAKSWRYNMGHYISFKENPKAYYNQPIELDARNFAAQVVNGI